MHGLQAGCSIYWTDTIFGLLQAHGLAIDAPLLDMKLDIESIK